MKKITNEQREEFARRAVVIAQEIRERPHGPTKPIMSAANCGDGPCRVLIRQRPPQPTMNRDEVIALAHRACRTYAHLESVKYGFTTADIVHFAELVAAREREACIKDCGPAWRAVDAIRARSGKEAAAIGSAMGDKL